MAELAGTTTNAGDTADDTEIQMDDDQAVSGDPLVEAELLVEDVSVDGMCGVY